MCSKDVIVRHQHCGCALACFSCCVQQGHAAKWSGGNVIPALSGCTSACYFSSSLLTVYQALCVLQASRSWQVSS